MLTIQTAVALGVRHSLHGPPSEELGELQLLQFAWDHLTAMHPWMWLRGRSALLSMVAGSDTVELPDDLTELIPPIQSSINAFGDVRIVTRSELDGYRANDLSLASNIFWATVVHAPADPELLGPPRMQLQVWPMPTVDAIESMICTYVGGRWSATNKPGDSSVIPLPDDGSCNALYVQIVRAFARGWEHDDTHSVEGELAMIADGRIFKAAKDRDNRRVHGWGRPKHGLLGLVSRTVGHLRLTQPVDLEGV